MLNKTTPLFSLGSSDLIKGVVLAFLAIIISSAQQWIQLGHLPTGAELISVLVIGLKTALAYFIKNFFTNSEGKLLKAEPLK